ncbi:MAG: hypothetical protein FWE76_04370 [Symbiobacteriaceae bacterium]|nr:hypothetical protein [Symbiobacteriaceae bacterium]
MIITRGLDKIQAKPRLLALGNFDGVHRGHSALLGRMAQDAREMQLPCAALTFEPHPQALLNPSSAPRLLSSAEEKSALLAALGLTELIVIDFDESFRHLSAREFVREILMQRCNARRIYVGAGYRFGYRGEGNVAVLREVLGAAGATVVELELLNDPATPTAITSSGIRAALQAGNLETALQMLGHPYRLWGAIVSDDYLPAIPAEPYGKIRFRKHILLPSAGIYEGEGLLPEESGQEARRYRILLRIKAAEEDPDNGTMVEARFIGSEVPVSGKQMIVSFKSRLGSQETWDSLVDQKIGEL